MLYNIPLQMRNSNLQLSSTGSDSWSRPPDALLRAGFSLYKVPSFIEHNAAFFPAVLHSTQTFIQHTVLNKQQAERIKKQLIRTSDLPDTKLLLTCCNKPLLLLSIYK